MAAGLALGGALAGVLASAGGAAPPDLRLRCDGRADVATSSSIHALKSGGLSTYTNYGHAREDARVLFELKDGAARLHLPARLVTAVHEGDVDGWWPVYDLKVTDEAISGRVRINIVNKPGFRIDRVNGDMELTGLTPFRGDCESTAAQERKF